MNRKLANEELGRLSPDQAKTSEKLPIVVILDDVRSMANVGSIFRTADAFGVSEIVLSGITPKPPHREIQKTALGATETVKWIWSERVMEHLLELKRSGFSVYSVEQAQTSLDPANVEFSNGEGVCLIFGNEVDGVKQGLIDISDHVLEIPQVGAKHSLNVSVAAGVVIWEAFKSLST